MSDEGKIPPQILDIGCHDGYVGAWLRERFQGEFGLDGLELHPGFAETARERGYRRVEEGLDPRDHFVQGAYDLVIGLEVLEHVPDVDEWLDALEAMLAPGGRVMVSTPDGTFGSGSNPHHLRALRAVDLADVLRRRGHLHDMEVGSDGVTCASYAPAPRRGEIAIYTGPSWMRWSPTDILTKGLGGSETAAVRLAEHLSFLGYVVTVYGEVEECAYRDVIFRRHEAFDPMDRRDCVIASRMPELADRPLNARTRLLWMHDVDCDTRLTEKRAEAFDHVLVLSKWHERHVQGRYPFLNGAVTRTRNGFEPSFFRDLETSESRETGERAKRVVYTSSPDRGLDLLLELWPQVREQVPDAELVYSYAPVYFEIAAKDPTVGAFAKRIEELADQEGVSAIGSLPQPEVARLMQESRVWVAPSWNTPSGAPFHETSCIGAMEAQAAGLHVVASNWGALSETVKVGALIDGPPFFDNLKDGELVGPWREAFVREIVRGLTDAETQEHAQREGPLAVADMSWQGVADQVVDLINARGRV